MATTIKKTKAKKLKKRTPSKQAKPRARQRAAQEPRPIWEIIVELGAQVPEEEWAKVPTDSSINYRHYLYSAPKRDFKTGKSIKDATAK